MNVKVTHQQQLARQVITVLQKLGQFIKEQCISKFVTLTGGRAVQAQKINLLPVQVKCQMHYIKRGMGKVKRVTERTLTC
jgi:hypothetical protein